MSKLNLTLLDQPDAVLVQHGLKALGFYSGTTLGQPGENTIAAYEAYQASLEPAVEGSSSLPWMEEAWKWNGLKEIPGGKHNPTILSWWEKLSLPFRDDETAWCAGYVGGVLASRGLPTTKSASARSYESYGTKIAKPCYGCIVVFWRGSKSGWMGHVAFVVGQASNGDLFCLGGNQSDSVNVSRFSRDRVLSYRWPAGSYPQRPLQIVSGPSQLSVNEA